MSYEGRNCLVSWTLRQRTLRRDRLAPGSGDRCPKARCPRRSRPRGRGAWGLGLQGPLPFQAGTCSQLLLQRQVPAGKARWGKQGAVPTAQRLQRRPPPRPLSAASPARRCSSVHNRKLTHPGSKIGFKKTSLRFLPAPYPQTRGGEEAGEKNLSFRSPARFCSLAPRPRTIVWIRDTPVPSFPETSVTLRHQSTWSDLLL
ncbi:ribonuclease 4 isoform X2 [Acinonyx jubatus]|uniref:Ribonuclease 4 isoform X2 n=1 Tax=Acinonyx jubatus TaxID=32536 RepID=A0ABM3Q8G3_ACIJB|nr:ribonuclease 4 isoform X2 [Acinonyx jubatus]